MEYVIVCALMLLCCVLILVCNIEISKNNKRIMENFKLYQEKPTDKVDEREKERQKVYEDHWDNVFNYTPEKAYKKVAK